jgi:large subunit ribosomal protein L5
MPVMLQSTMRKTKATDFLDRFYKLVLPRIRDFEGTNPKSFDNQANLTLGLKTYDIFPEL